MSRLRARYGGGPAHLLATLASFAIAGAAIFGWTQRPRDLTNVLIWFVAAIVLHDLVLLPLYSLLDRITLGRLPLRVAAYARVPALVSALVLAAVFPTVLGFGAHQEHNASGIVEHGYLARYLLLTGGLFALSGLAFAVSVRRERS
jgi:Na+/melibiose symporter-like transporter